MALFAGSVNNRRRSNVLSFFGDKERSCRQIIASMTELPVIRRILDARGSEGRGVPPVPRGPSRGKETRPYFWLRLLSR
jgi:hypothetical protein